MGTIDVNHEGKIIQIEDGLETEPVTFDDIDLEELLEPETPLIRESRKIVEEMMDAKL